MRASILVAAAALSILALPALAEGDSKVVQQIEHIDSDHTQITIKDYRHKAAKPARPVAEPTFREYDLTPARGYTPPVAPRPVMVQAAPMMQSYSQNYAPGPNTGMAANGFYSGGSSSILSTGPIYGYGAGGYGYGAGGYGAGAYGYGLGAGAYGYGVSSRAGGYAYPGIYSPLSTYSNAIFINSPQQRFNPPTGYAYPFIPQSYATPGYVYPGGGFAPGGGGGVRGRRN